MIRALPERLAHLRIWEEAVRDAFPTFDEFERPGGWRAMMTPEGLAGELERSGFVGIETQPPLRQEWPVSPADWLLAQVTDSNPIFERLYGRLGSGSLNGCGAGCWRRCPNTR